VAALVDRLDPHPTYVTGRHWDVLAANRGARGLFVDWQAMPQDGRNIVWWMLTSRRAREVFADWELEARAYLARFRADAARHPDDPAFAGLVTRIREASPEARAWWARLEVLPLGGGQKRLRHPAIGERAFELVVLQVAGNRDQKLVTFSCPGHDDALRAIAESVGEGT
jgi:MmyB-like transcription regulator ligand binding domain